MRATTALSLALLLTAAAPALAQNTKTTEPGQAPARQAGANDLIGTYEIVSGEEEGKALPAERIAGSRVRIEANRMVITDKDDKETYVATYELSPANPNGAMTIAMKQVAGPEGRKGANARGLIQREGETVRLIYTPEGGKVPTTFRSEPDSKQNQFVLKRVAGN